MNVREAAARLGLDENTVYRLCQRGALPHHRYGRRVVIAEADLIAFQAAHRIEGGSEPAPPRPPARSGLDWRKAIEGVRQRIAGEKRSSANRIKN